MHSKNTEKPEKIQCNTCKELKLFTFENFEKHANYPFGLRKQCRDCRKEQKRKRYKPKPRIKPDYLNCNKCGERKPFTLEYFVSDVKLQYGLRFRCKACNNKLTKHTKLKSYHKTKKQNKEILNERNRLARLTQKGKFKQYRSRSAHKKCEFTLTFEEFCTFWQQPCWYCKRQITTIGLDRVDNAKGYILENVVACCETCNRAKLAQTKEEFLLMCKLVSTNHCI